MRGLRTMPSLIRNDFEMVKSHLLTPGPRRSARRVGSVRNVNGSLGLNCVRSNHSSTVCGLLSDVLMRSGPAFALTALLIAQKSSYSPLRKDPTQLTCQTPKTSLTIELAFDSYGFPSPI